MADVDERTPLISGGRRQHDQYTAYLMPAVQRHASPPASLGDLDNADLFFTSHTEQRAFQLVFLLYMRSLRLHAMSEDSISFRLDPVEKRRRERENGTAVRKLEAYVEESWIDLVEDDNTDGADVQDVLWSRIPFSHGQTECVRVLDLMVASPTNLGLVADPLLTTSLETTWTNGLCDSVVPNSLWDRYDTLATPRVLHSLHLLFDLIHLFLVLSYLLQPTVRYATLREVSVVIYSIASLLWYWSPVGLIHALILVAFFISRPKSPIPDTFPFLLLIVFVALRAYLYHLPYAPSPLYLFTPHRILPLPSLLHSVQNRIVIPVVLLFIPIFLFSLFMLSFSINDTFLTWAASPAPMQSRIAFLVFASLVVVLLLSSLFMLSTQHDRSSSTNYGWDKYGSTVGFDARISFLQTLLVYTSNNFPPPFNFVRMVTIGIPTNVLRIPLWDTALDKILWRLFVGPFVAVITLGWKVLDLIREGRYRLWT